MITWRNFSEMFNINYYLVADALSARRWQAKGNVSKDWVKKRTRRAIKENIIRNKEIYRAFFKKRGFDWFESITGFPLDKERICRDVNHLRDAIEAGIEIEGLSDTDGDGKRRIREQIIKLKKKEFNIPAWQIRAVLVALGTPAWADKKQISTIYKQAKQRKKQTGIDLVVDHIVPVNHKLVCGLHVPDNLQVITAEENNRKGNRFYP